MKTILNEEYEIIFEFNNGKKYNASYFFDKSNANNNNFQITKFLEFSQIIKIEGEYITLTRFPLKCHFNDIGEKIVYSIQHLDLIIKKLNYTEPYYNSKYSDGFISLKDLDSKWHIFIDEEIFIEDLTFSKEKNEKIFIEQTKILNDFRNLEYNRNYFPYKAISYNLNNYIEINSNTNLDDIFYYEDTPERRRLQREVENFLLDTKNFIYGIFGPYGIGKSLTSIVIQKCLYIKNYRTIYINLKFYKKNISEEIKFQTLLSECFFLCEDENDFELFHKLLLENKNKDIWFCINLIYNHIKETNKDLTKYLFIIDQYKQNFDKNYSVLNFPDIHIFILSSINDKDIKTSLKSSIKGTEVKINYHYIDILIKDTISGILLHYKDKIILKITSSLNYTDEEKFNFILKIIKLFGNLPRFIFVLIDKYYSIFDLLNDEYKKTFVKLNEFYKSANFQTIAKLIEKNYFSKTELKSLSKIDFLNIINDIPLKYINYKEKDNSYYLEYSFPLSKIILEDFTLFCKNINTFKIINKDNDIGSGFEFIVKIYMRVFNMLEIDGYIEVNSMINLKLGDNYQYIDKTYFNGKKMILFALTNKNAKSFDFGLYRPEENILVLLQSKYIINNSNVSTFDSYKKDAEKVKKQFEKQFSSEIKAIYFLYISSYQYNIKRQLDVLKCLQNNKINCIFFDFENNILSFDFKNLLTDIKLDESYIIYPYSKERKYIAQWEEKPIKSESNNIWNILFNKKRYTNYRINKYEKEENIDDFKKILYQNFLKLIKEYNNLDDDLVSHLGVFFEFYLDSFGGSISIPDFSIYIFVFKTLDLINKNDPPIDESKGLGLIYVKDEKIVFFDMKDKKEIKEDDFIKLFENYSYALGKFNQK